MWGNFSLIFTVRTQWCSWQLNLWKFAGERNPPNTGLHGVCHYQASAHSASSKVSKFPYKCSYQFMSPAASASGKPDLRRFVVFTCLSRFQGGDLPCNLISLMGLKVVDLHSAQLFISFSYVTASKLFTCSSWTVCFSNSNCKILPFLLTLPYLLAAPGKETLQQDSRFWKEHVGPHQGPHSFYSEFSKVENTFALAAYKGRSLRMCGRFWFLHSSTRLCYFTFADWHFLLLYLT